MFLCAGLLRFPAARLSHMFGAVAGLLALTWFIWTEASFPPGVNSWVMLNVPDGILPGGDGLLVFTRLKIPAAAFVLTATLWSAMRLLPAAMAFRGVPLSQRTWLAAVLSAVLLAFWFSTSVTPYRVPIIIDAHPPECRILHINKSGPQFRETLFSVFRDHRFLVARVDRRLFQYRFDGRFVAGTMPETTQARIRAVMQSLQQPRGRGQAIQMLPAREGESWYVDAGHGRPLAFTAEYATPPSGLVGVLHEIERLPTVEEGSWPLRDVCLGFCYDAAAYYIHDQLLQPAGNTR
jgi:hypothetical protein